MATLLVAASASALTGLAFVLLGWRLVQRPVAPDLRRGQVAHALWWSCLGAYLVLQATLTALAWAGRLTADTYFASRVLAIPLLCVAVWGLCAHLAFLWTGSTRIMKALAALYVVVAAIFAYATVALRPPLLVETWIVGLDDSHVSFRLVYATIGAPPLVAAVVYLRLASRAPDPLQRRRAYLTAAAMLTYIGAGLAARLAARDLVVFLTMVPLGLMAAATALLAQAPSVRPAPPAPLVPEPEFARRLRELL